MSSFKFPDHRHWLAYRLFAGYGGSTVVDRAWMLPDDSRLRAVQEIFGRSECGVRALTVELAGAAAFSQQLHQNSVVAQSSMTLYADAST